MSEWVDIVKAFLSEYWLPIIAVLVVVYYTYHYLMLIVSVLVFPLVAIGSTFWGLSKQVVWPEDEGNRLSGRNVCFFIAGSLAFVIEIYLFSIFLEAYLLGEAVIPIFGKWGVEMSILSGIAFGLLALIFGHLAHHMINRGGTRWESLIGWMAAGFFVLAALVLGYSGAARAQIIADAQDATTTVKNFSILIGGVFGFMMPFGAVVGMSRGGFLWHLVRNILLGIPLTIGLVFLIVAAFFFFLFDVVLSLLTMPVRQLCAIIGGFFGLRPNKENTDELTGWRIGVNQVLSHAEPQERLRQFLENTRKYMNFWEEEKKMVKRKRVKLPPPPSDARE